MGHQISYVCLVDINTHISINCKKMCYINHIDFFPIHRNVCTYKSLKRTCPSFYPVSLLSKTKFDFLMLLESKASKGRTKKSNMKNRHENKEVPYKEE